MSNGNHIGDSNDMVVGDNDHGDAVPKCGSCGVAWVDHMGIMGVCAENAKLRKERDEARREASYRTNSEFLALCKYWENDALSQFIAAYKGDPTKLITRREKRQEEAP